jgi:hypothetical protein
MTLFRASLRPWRPLRELNITQTTLKTCKALVTPLDGVLLIVIRLTQIILVFSGAANR